MEIETKRLFLIFAAAVVVLVAIASIVAVFWPQSGASYSPALTQQETNTSYAQSEHTCDKSLLSGGENDSYIENVQFEQNSTIGMLMVLNSTFEGRDNTTGYLERKTVIDMYYNYGGEISTIRIDNVITMDDNYSCIDSISTTIVDNKSSASNTSCMGMQVMPTVCGDNSQYIGDQNVTTPFGTFDAQVYMTSDNATVWTNKQFSVPLKSIEQGEETDLISYTKG